MNWMAAAHQSAAPGARRQDAARGRRPLSASWMKAASVKKIEPAKKVAASPHRSDRRRVRGDRPDGEEDGSDGEAPGLTPQTQRRRVRGIADGPADVRRRDGLSDGSPPLPPRSSR